MELSHEIGEENNLSKEVLHNVEIENVHEEN